MALDDKTFQSAIAKINKMKLRQSHSIPQIQVFEDPPHLKKQEKIFQESRGASEIQDATLNTSLKEETKNPHEDNYLKSERNNGNDHIEPQEVSDKDTIKGTIKGTNNSTYKGTIKGTHQTSTQNRVQTYGTDSGTTKGTGLGYKTNFGQTVIPLQYEHYLYNRSYNSLSGIPKKIVDIIFEICRISVSDL